MCPIFLHYSYEFWTIVLMFYVSYWNSWDPWSCVSGSFMLFVKSFVGLMRKGQDCLPDMRTAYIHLLYKLQCFMGISGPDKTDSLTFIISHIKNSPFKQSLIIASGYSIYIGRKKCNLYNKHKHTWLLANTRCISRVEHDISYSEFAALAREVSCSTLEIILYFRAPTYYSLCIRASNWWVVNSSRINLLV